ncbi:MAG: endonuclease MutS2 [Lachnospiraceae bacterium]|nr:endonuclease MutS2 [Lachnospiraceae bacterium]
MNEKVLHTLEYDKILLRLEALAGSEGAKAMCRALRPMTEREAILTALSETTDAAARLSAKGSLAFGGISDIRASVKRAESGSSLSIIELLRVEKLLQMADRAKIYGKTDRDTPPDSLTERFDALEPATALFRELEADILSEEEIADSASPGLAKVRRELRTISDRIHNELNALLIKNRDLLQDAVVTMRDGRYCLPVKAEHKSQVSGIVHDQSGSGKALFIEPISVVRLNNEWRELEIREQKEIEAVLADLSGKVVSWGNAVVEDYRLLTELDFIFAKARLSRSDKGIAPELEEGRLLDLRRARHPLLDPKTVVPIDVKIGGNYDQLIITGPNTGGKTVSLKTVGLLALMGQSGLHIPAGVNSRIPIFKEVFADIGDEQSIEQSLSTFSSHMKNIVEIMAKADPDSLCLFDELGAGTDPTEGAALAMAILTRLHTDAIRTMATTHYSELKIYALNTEGVENASCEFDVATLRPTYRLLVGVPGKSNAFAIAKKLGLDESIIEEAGSYINSNEEAFEDVIAELDRQRREMEKAELEIRRLKRDTEQMKAEAEQRRGTMEAQREKLLREAREEARAILQEAKDTADKAIKDMRKSGQSVSREQEDIRSALRLAVQDTDDRLAEADAKARRERQVTVTEKKLRLGDTVHVHSLGLKGTVISLPDAKGDLTVQMGILKSKVNASDVELVPEATTTLEGRRHVGNGGGNSFQKALTISTEINLIGQTTDEAVLNLEKYIDDAYLAHMEKIRIIHGRGTGALKGAVTRALQKNRYIKSFESAPFNEGGYGATIAYLKGK